MNIEELLIKLSEEMRLRAFTKETQKNYIYNISEFLKYLKYNNQKISSENLKQYFLEHSKKHDINSVKLRKAAVKFFIINILKREKIIFELPKMKKKNQLPKVLSKLEIKELINNIKNRQHKLMIQLLYSSGLRVSELIFLKRECLNLNDKTIRVEQGKGRKDRTTIFSERVKVELMSYLTQNEFKTKYLFETNRKQHHTTRSIQEILKVASEPLKKHVTPHMLRHSFATHLLDSGIDIRLIQKLLGHSNLETTSIYTYVSNKDIKNIISPDDL